MQNAHRPTIGLALSGSGNRTTFYIGFLEVLQEQNVTVDYLSACSGGSLVAAAYACGTLKKFKDMMLALDKKSMMELFAHKNGKRRGGLYSLDRVEDEMRMLTGGRNFADVRPLMAFTAVDIETGDLVVLSMGDIARAARISCTLPGIFEPVKWGGKTLVDGGLLTQVPSDILQQANVDISIGINMRGTKYIFTDNQITFHRVVHWARKLLFIDLIDSALNHILHIDPDEDREATPGIFGVLGRSLDLALAAKKKEDERKEAPCDLMITPVIVRNSTSDLSELEDFYRMGREAAEEYVPKIKKMIEERQAEKVASIK